MPEFFQFKGIRSYRIFFSMCLGCTGCRYLFKGSQDQKVSQDDRRQEPTPVPSKEQGIVESLIQQEADKSICHHDGRSIKPRNGQERIRHIGSPLHRES